MASRRAQRPFDERAYFIAARPPFRRLHSLALRTLVVVNRHGFLAIAPLDQCPSRGVSGAALRWPRGSLLRARAPRAHSAPRATRAACARPRVRTRPTRRGDGGCARGCVSPRVRGSLLLVQPLRVLRPRARRVDAPGRVRHLRRRPRARGAELRRRAQAVRGEPAARGGVRRPVRERRRHVARSDVALVRARDVRGGRAGSARRGVLRRPRGGGEGEESAGGGRGGGR